MRCRALKISVVKDYPWGAPDLGYSKHVSSMCHLKESPTKMLTNRTGNFPRRTPHLVGPIRGDPQVVWLPPAPYLQSCQNTDHPYVKGRVSNTSTGTPYLHLLDQCSAISLGLDVLIAQVRVRVEGRDQQTFGIKAASCERSQQD